MASALFSINSDLTDQGFQATNLQVLTLRLRQQPPIGVNTVLFQVFAPSGFNPELGIAQNPPRASLSAPTLTIVGGTSGQAVSPASVDGSVTITMPATGSHSWIVRCVVNGGLRTLPNGVVVADPTLIHERGVWIPTALGARKVVCTELRQFSDGGWADALAALPDLIIPDNSIAAVKLINAAAAPSVLGASVNGPFAEMSQATLAGLLRGVGLTVDSTGKLRPIYRPRRFELIERFIGGGVTSGAIGAYNWHLLGTGTPVFARINGDLQSSSRASLTTSGAANDTAVLCLGEALNRTVGSAALSPRLHFVHNFNSDTANKRAFFGWSTNFGDLPTAVSGCIGFLYDSGVSGNWQIIGRSGGVGTPTVTAQAIPPGAAELLTIHQSAPGIYDFYSGATLIGTISSGAPTGAMNLGIWIQNINAASHNQRLGGIWMTAEGFAGAYDDDAFLEA